jgi:hypothetical protein
LLPPPTQLAHQAGARRETLSDILSDLRSSKKSQKQFQGVENCYAIQAAERFALSLMQTT